MSGSNSLALIEKLSGRENYATWRFAVKTYLQHEELWHCIENADQTTMTSKEDTKAKTKIILLVEPVNYVHIQEATTAKEVWDNLSRAFDDSGLTRRVGLLRDLCTTTLSGCQNVEDYVSKIITTALKLRNIGFKVDDEWLGTLLLSGLPESYQPMIIAIESSGVTISADSVKSKLLQDIRQTSNETTAFATKHYQKNKKQFSKGPRCYTCNKYGHKSPECKSKTKKKTDKYVDTQSGSTYAAAFIVSTENSDTWFVDSGASMHMTKHKNLLLKECLPNVKNIKVANNKTLQVLSSGQVSLTVYDGKGQKNDILFKNVLHVPELATNLISVSKIVENGGQVKFHNKGCVIMNSQNIIVATASLLNNMYRLNVANTYACMSDVNETDNYLWHQRMGHLNFQTLKKMTENTDGISMSRQNNNLTCITCQEGKQARLPFTNQGSHSTKLLELVHTDVCGPMETKSIGGARYFVTFLDDFSKKIFVYTMHKKSEVLQKFKDFKLQVENQLEAKLKILRSDNGLEYVNKDMSDFLKSAGIIHQTTTPYTPEQNGTAERMNRTLVERARCMLLNANLPKQYWGEALTTAAYIINRSPTRTLSFKTPEEMWSGQKPNVSHLRTFGCEAMVHLPKEKRKKWDSKAHKMIFVGYCENTKGYRFIIPTSKNIIKSRDAVFLESTVKRNYVPLELSETKMNKINVMEEIEDNGSTTSFESTENGKYTEIDSEYLPDESIETNPCSSMNLRPRIKQLNTNKQENTYLCLNEELQQDIPDIPVTYEEAIKSIESKEWRKSIDEELEAHHKNETWTLVKKPSNAKVIGCRWVFRIKDEPTGPRFKSRLCAKGYAQTKGIDYMETFAPTVRYDSIRLLLSIAVQHKYEIIQLDIKTAFLYGELEETIYMTPPSGLNCENNMVCRLNKSLYGLKQAPRTWNSKFDLVLKKLGFINSKADQCVYVGQVNDEKCYLCLYVDDGLLFSKSKSTINTVIDDLKTVFEMRTYPPTNFVGMQIEKGDKYIFIHQSKYIEQLLYKFNMENANSNSVPVDPHTKLEKSDHQPEKNIPYREAVGSLMHAAIVSRPDIMFAVSLVSRFLNCFDESHWNAVKKILKYLKDTKDYGLCYHLTDQSSDLIGYSDADYANDIVTRRSVSGYVFIKNGAAVTWASQRQQTVALSTTESEFMAACAATKEAIWAKQLLSDVDEFKQRSVCLNLDNQSAICVIKNINFHKRCKHIDIKYNFIKEKYHDKIITLNYVCSENQYADILTKALSKVKFQFLRSKIGMCNTFESVK